jgi:DNA-binding transcriptional LysR family regulator
MDTLDALRILVSIDEAGSPSGAARQQSVAVSTVTLALQQLEANAAVRLITRSTRRLSFTYEGQRFLADARKLLADWDASLDGVRERELTGPIRFSATQDFGAKVVVPLIDRFLEVHPGVQFDLKLSDGALDLAQNDLDFALRNGPLSESSLKARLLIKGRRVICASPDYWRTHDAPGRPQDLRDHNCMVVSRPGNAYSTWPFLINGKRCKVKVRGNRMANNSTVLLNWAIGGHGVILRTAWNIRQELQSGALVPVLDEFLPNEANLYAVYNDGISSRRVTTLMDFLADALEDVA